MHAWVDEELLEQFLDGRLDVDVAATLKSRLEAERELREHLVGMLLFRATLSQNASAQRRRECEEARSSFLSSHDLEHCEVTAGAHFASCATCALAREIFLRKETAARGPGFRIAPAHVACILAATAFVAVAIVVATFWVGRTKTDDPASTIRQDTRYIAVVEAIDALTTTPDLADRERLYFKIHQASPPPPPEAVMWALARQESDAALRSSIYHLTPEDLVTDGPSILAAIEREITAGSETALRYLVTLLGKTHPEDGVPVALRLIQEAAQRGGAVLEHSTYLVAATEAFPDSAPLQRAIEGIADHSQDQGCQALARLCLIRRAAQRYEAGECARQLEQMVPFLGTTDEVVAKCCRLAFTRYADAALIDNLHARLAPSSPGLAAQLLKLRGLAESRTGAAQ